MLPNSIPNCWFSVNNISSPSYCFGLFIGKGLLTKLLQVWVRAHKGWVQMLLRSKASVLSWEFCPPWNCCNKRLRPHRHSVWRVKHVGSILINLAFIRKHKQMSGLKFCLSWEKFVDSQKKSNVTFKQNRNSKFILYQW